VSNYNLRYQNSVSFQLNLLKKNNDSCLKTGMFYIKYKKVNASQCKLKSIK